MTTLVDCPQSRQAEWRFRLFGVDVTVKFWFWISTVFLAVGRELDEVLIWVAVCFASILLHEFGHVFAFRLFGCDAEAVLYAWGGLAIPRRDVRGPAARFLVAVAGPAAGFCAVAVVMAAVHLAGATVLLQWHMLLPVLWAVPALAGRAAAETPSHYHWYLLANDLLYVNFYWGLVNLLPIYPLDGGHAARAILEQRDPWSGRRHSLILSVAAATLFAILGLVEMNLYIVVLFGVLAISSAQSLEGERRHPARNPYRS